MRGKKKDSEFLSNFITECVQKEKNSPDDIVIEAKRQVAIIDQQIKEVEKLKIVRSKLLDVIDTFDLPEKLNQSDEIRLLSFFKIHHPTISKYICDTLQIRNFDINSLYSTDKGFAMTDVAFCIKQLLELKVVSKVGQCILRGERFDEYSKFVLGK